MNPICHLRVFDLKKYQRIEPIIWSINDGDFNLDEVISLVEEASNKIEAEEFQLYNQMNDGLEDFTYAISEVLDIAQSGDLSEWRSSNIIFSTDENNTEEENDTEYIVPYIVSTISYENSLLEQENLTPTNPELNTNSTELSSLKNRISFTQAMSAIVFSICCPKYQHMVDYDTTIISNATINYSDDQGILHIFNRNLWNLLEEGTLTHPVTYLPFSYNRTTLLPSELIETLTNIVIKDLSYLSQPNCVLYLIRNEVRTPMYYCTFSELNQLNLNPGDFATFSEEDLNPLINFYKSLGKMLDLIKTDPSYTIANELLY